MKRISLLCCLLACSLTSYAAMDNCAVAKAVQNNIDLFTCQPGPIAHGDDISHALNISVQNHFDKSLCAVIPAACETAALSYDSEANGLVQIIRMKQRDKAACYMASEDQGMLHTMVKSYIAKACQPTN